MCYQLGQEFEMKDLGCLLLSWKCGCHRRLRVLGAIDRYLCILEIAVVAEHGVYFWQVVSGRVEGAIDDLDV